jgi:hypothetical protein
MDKHSSLFVWSISNEEKCFNNFEIKAMQFQEEKFDRRSQILKGYWYLNASGQGLI